MEAEEYRGTWSSGWWHSCRKQSKEQRSGSTIKNVDGSRKSLTQGAGGEGLGGDAGVGGDHHAMSRGGVDVRDVGF
jgi:hypothetical protein